MASISIITQIPQAAGLFPPGKYFFRRFGLADDCVCFRDSESCLKGCHPTYQRRSVINLLARKRHLIPELQQLAGKILRVNELPPDFERAALSGYTACARRRMNESESRRKVGCHVGLWVVDRRNPQSMGNRSRKHTVRSVTDENQKPSPAKLERGTREIKSAFGRASLLFSSRSHAWRVTMRS
jgi:hypothetical protein